MLHHKPKPTCSLGAAAIIKKSFAPRERLASIAMIFRSQFQHLVNTSVHNSIANESGYDFMRSRPRIRRGSGSQVEQLIPRGAVFGTAGRAELEGPGLTCGRQAFAYALIGSNGHELAMERTGVVTPRAGVPRTTNQRLLGRPDRRRVRVGRNASNLLENITQGSHATPLFIQFVLKNLFCNVFRHALRTGGNFLHFD